jgi:hypothetical protein
MPQLALDAGQPAANLPQTVSPPKLAEKHGDKLRPAIEPLGSVLRLAPTHSGFELSPRKNREQLAENTGKLSHERDSFRWSTVVFITFSLASDGSPFHFSLDSNHDIGTRMKKIKTSR